MKKLLRFTLIGLCGLAAAYFLMPLRLGISHIGMYYPAALFFLVSFILAFPERCLALWRGPRRRIVRILAACVAVGVAAVLGVCVLIGTAANNAPAEDEEVTVVVLGCQVVGERPSTMLQGRIERAYAYLSAHPEAMCVATGGKGDDENISEGECIRRTLVSMGIPEERIFVEDQSVNTAQNMAFSAEIIADHHLPTTIAVVSDNFHQLRASIFAGRSGLDSRALGCASPWFLGPGYWAREVLALGAAFVRGY